MLNIDMRKIYNFYPIEPAPDAANLPTGGDIYYDDAWLALAGSPTLTIESTTTATLVEFWSYDGGSTVYAKYLGQFSTP